MSENAAIDNERDGGDVAVWRIQPAPPSVPGQLAAVWRYRHLYWFFTVRALFHIYRNAILGVGWMVIHPLVIVVPATFIVGNLFGVSSDPVPLPLFIIVGLANWILFRRSLQWMTKSMGMNRPILRQTYVPALLLLAATISPGLFEFAVVLSVAVVLAIYFGPVEGIYYVTLSWQLLAVPLVMVMSLLLAMGLACFTSLLHAVAKDTWLTLRYALSGWMLATPILYPIEVIPPDYRWLAYLNPLTSIVELFRWAVLQYGTVHWGFLGLAAVEILAILFCGIWFFAKQQNRLFDHM